MPYIKKAAREMLAEGHQPADSGELNYQITKVITTYLASHTFCYRTINDIVGALEGAKMEFYRRVAAPYEDTKIKENGDVY